MRTTTEKKDAFIIIRIATVHKTKLQKRADKEEFSSLSEYIRTFLEKLSE